jgi:large subunit ribosomal protein L4
MEIKVVNIEGKETGNKVTLSDSIFGIEPNDHAIYLDVKQFLANQRQGTHKSKQRNEISGSTRKLHKQKGTGGSRKGGIKNPLFRGGGRVFGPQPRDYKAKNNDIVVLEDFNFETPKTKNFISLVNNLKIAGKKSLLVLGASNDNVYLSSRNLQKSKVITAYEISTYDLLHADKLVLTSSSVKTIEESLSK